MIGIVVVSHSRALGDAVAALAKEMVGGDKAPALAVAAGLDETTFGTDATAVASAIEEVAASSDGVLVLVDIGSSVLSAELACELVDPDLVERVRISSAPLVEGMVPAVVSAASGASLDEVAGEAEEGLDAKRAHLGGSAGFDTQPRSSAATQPASDDARSSAAAQPAVSAEFVLTDPHGLHARPAAKLVALVRSYDARVTLTDLDTGAGPVSASSLSKVATLNAGHGARLQVAADGSQADEAVQAVVELAARNFEDAPTGEPQTPAPSGPPPSSGSGLDAAMGPAYVLHHEVNIEDYQPGSPSDEHERSDGAVAAVADAIRRQRDTDPAAADILDAHLALLQDEAVVAPVAEHIEDGRPAPSAWRAVLQGLAADFEALADPYQRARAQDVRAMERQLLTVLVDGPEALAAQADSVPDGAIVVVDELDPATASGLDAGAVAGVVTMRGGSTGHGVIVARSRGIPIFTDGGDAASDVESGTIVGFDASTRLLVIDPDAASAERLRDTIARREADATEAHHRAGEPAVTSDHAPVRVGANITSRADAVSAAASGAEGSGLVRTEILFGSAPALPLAREQAEAFVSIGRALHDQPITIRTWDVGGDKPLPFLPGPHEVNPMLGVRGLRLMRQHAEAFDAQLEAVCAAAEQTPVRVMFPMVTAREEVDWALERLATARSKVGSKLGPEKATVQLEVGIMVEVPAAALRIAELAAGLDFVSIGTNDLTQYTLATDRGNAGVSELADGLDPAVLQLIRRVAVDVPDGVEVGVCGDLASRVDAVPLLVGLGIRELSAVGPMIPRIKQAVRRTSAEEASRLAERALRASSARAVRELLAAHR
ncbi:MAG TPA: phosphoenolpyruvate--protein phosphotransferase [Flexivirga sp.]|uniref:phosphoenolpyruvate--protein phosphotransferase n=1 Tax=Flexivirga sp. TaxID=1962927 RepID=UPI002B772799|nr:phosphoenolpyruvate--protein phosphotransferase [Flexivirga sp.]HWC24396.1 phosphoenolpyruvate--protein phosphotransferase [Flexivirga sp.]